MAAFVDPSTANDSAIDFVIDTVEDASNIDVGLLRKILDTNTKISSEQRLLAERALKRCHHNALNALSPQQKHELALELVNEYDGRSNTTRYYFCNLCSKKECERYGSDTTRNYKYCNKCRKEVCDNCDSSLIEWINSDTGDDFTCNACTLASKQTE